MSVLIILLPSITPWRYFDLNLQFLVTLLVFMLFRHSWYICNVFSIPLIQRYVIVSFPNLELSTWPQDYRILVVVHDMIVEPVKGHGTPTPVIAVITLYPCYFFKREILAFYNSCLLHLLLNWTMNRNQLWRWSIWERSCANALKI